MRCPSCQHENPPSARFCQECTAPLAHGCSNCGNLLPDDAKFCPECAHPVTEAPKAPALYGSPTSYTPKYLAEKILTSKSALEGERKQVTVLFCDIVGSTVLAAQVGAEAMHRNLDVFFTLALKTAHRYEGTINQFLGDGFMALFGAPLAHEDHARRAVLAALDFQRELDANVGLFPPGVKISARIGLNTGNVVVGKIGDDLRMDYTAIGDTVNVAARLQQAAKAGKILLSDATYRAVSDHVDCRSLPAIQVKGKADPIPVYEPYRVRAATEARQQRLRTSALPFVGREGQLDTLRQSFANLVRGRGGVIVVIGEPGLGKSRLLAEARKITAEMPLQWFEGSALSYGRTLSYWPFLEIVRACAGINEADDEGQGWTKLEREVTRLFPEPDVAEVLPYLGTMLALAVSEQYSERVKYLDGLAMGHQISRSSRKFFERIAQDKPTVLLFEDWHWADESSLGLLEHLLPLQASVPLLLCIATRPDPKGALGKLRSALEKLEAPYRELTLPPLAAEQGTAIVGSLIGPGALSPQLHELLLQRTGGNPFFLEELVKSLLEMGAFVWDGGAGQWRMNAEVDHSALPSTIEAVLLARIDRLDEGLKQVLRTASVIGRVFFYRVLRALAESDVDLESRLTALQAIDLINEKRHVPELEYIFKHALIQQAAYDSMLTERRHVLHLRVGQCLEQIFSDRLEEFYSVIAYYAKAEAWSKAQEYLFKAGDQAGSIAADAEALEHYRKAVAAYDQEFKGRQDTLQRTRIDRKIGEALFRTGQHDLAHSHLERAARRLGCPYPTSPRAVRFALLGALLREGAVNLSKRLLFRREVRVPLDPRNAELCRIWEAMGWIDFFLDGERAFLDVLLLKKGAEGNSHSAEFVIALAHIGVVLDVTGVYGIAARYHREAMRRAKETNNSLAIGHSYQNHAMHDYHVGAWDSALTNWKEAASIYWATGNLRYWGGAFSMYVHTLLSKGDANCLATVQEQVRIAGETQDQQLQGWARVGMCRALLREGAYETAVIELEAAATQLELVPDYRILAWTLAELAAAHLRLGRPDSALDAIARSFRLIKDRRLTGFSITRPMTMRAEVCLFACERLSGTKRKAMLKAAARACNAAAKQGKAVRDDGASSSLRLCGTYAWLTDDPRKAQHLWNRSIEIAESLGAKYALAETNLEIGRRLTSRPHLVRAEALFLETGAQADLSLTQQLLRDSA